MTKPTFKQMNILWNIVDCSIRKDDVIKRIGLEKYEYYYPLYLITKNNKFKNLVFKFIGRRKKN